jgi:hypothetical protein
MFCGAVLCFVVNPFLSSLKVACTTAVNDTRGLGIALAQPTHHVSLFITFLFFLRIGEILRDNRAGRQDRGLL